MMTTTQTTSMSTKRRQQVPEGPVVFPRDVVERVDRVTDYHNASKHTYQSVREKRMNLDWANHPSAYRTFVDDLPSVPLPRDLLDASTPTLALLADGVGAAGAGVVHPKQDLRTL